MTRVAKTALGMAVMGGLLFGAASAVGAATPAGGTVKIFASPNTSGTGETFVVTGAIADYGKTVRVNSAGKPDKNGVYTQIVGKQGTVLLDGTQFQAALNAAQPTDFDTVTCSGSLVASAPDRIVSGTKLYSGISGSVDVTGTVAFILPRTKSGQCDLSGNATVVAHWGSITGSGTVSFS